MRSTLRSEGVSHGLPHELRHALSTVARVPRLLVAADFDGTLAPIVDRPDDARPLPDSTAALSALAGLPSTTAALISGRALRDLATLSGTPAGVHLVGSHGAEFDTGFVHPISDAAMDHLDMIINALTGIAADYAGATIERKPASVALHVRNAAPNDAQAALDRARSAARSWNAHLTEGKAVVEFAIITPDKGRALDDLRRRDDASAVVFLGDDVTDENAFRRLQDPDIGIKVGEGDTLAQYRVKSPDDVAAALAYLLDERRTWLRNT